MDGEKLLVIEEHVEIGMEAANDAEKELQIAVERQDRQNRRCLYCFGFLLTLSFILVCNFLGNPFASS